MWIVKMCSTVFHKAVNNNRMIVWDTNHKMSSCQTPKRVEFGMAQFETNVVVF